MEHQHKAILDTFDEQSLPDLDVAVLGALELFREVTVPSFDISQFAHPLVLGSGNAEVTGRILFNEHDAIYADESTCSKKLESAREGIKNAVIISASGKKHAVEITENLKERGITTWLLTNNPDAPARAHVDDARVLVFPKNREPYTYNTSTYMGIILGKTGEDPARIHEFITKEVTPHIRDDFGKYDAFYLIIPPECIPIRDMLLTKFDELFGARVSGRVFTLEQSKHAKTVVPSPTEFFISFGEKNELFGDQAHRLHIPLPKDTDYVTLMAIGYYVIGHIQKQHPPYFKERIKAYTDAASHMFNQKLAPVVE